MARECNMLFFGDFGTRGFNFLLIWRVCDVLVRGLELGRCRLVLHQQVQQKCSILEDAQQLLLHVADLHRKALILLHDNEFPRPRFSFQRFTRVTSWFSISHHHDKFLCWFFWEKYQVAHNHEEPTLIQEQKYFSGYVPDQKQEFDRCMRQQLG